MNDSNYKNHINPSIFLYTILILSIISLVLQDKYLHNATIQSSVFWKSSFSSERNKRNSNKQINNRDYLNEPFHTTNIFLKNTLKKEIPFRKFNYWNESFPCFSDYDNRNKVGRNLRGLLYIKIHKASSSTLAGINLRIAHRHYENISDNNYNHSNELDLNHINKYNNVSYCGYWWNHKKAHKLEVKHRNPSSTYLWTFMRHPTKRLLSHFWFFDEGIIKNTEIYSNDIKLRRSFEKSIRTKALNNYQLHFMNPYALEDENNKSKEDIVYTIAQNILETYDFIGLVERMDESLVALQLLFDLDPGDILYTSSKVSGNYVANLYFKCSMRIPVPKVLPRPIYEHVSSDKYYKENFGDFLLYQAVNKSLDITIQDRIGKDVFERALKEHRYLMKLIKERCQDRAISLCSKDGVEQWNISNCYKRDFGCGYPCLDELYVNESTLRR